MIEAFVASIGALGRLKIIGDSPSPDLRPPEHRVGANLTAFHEMEANEPVTGLKAMLAAVLAAEPAKPTAAQNAREADALRQAWEAGETLLKMAALLRRRSRIQREALFTLLSVAWEKPDFVVRRDAAGPERDRLFPLVESWDAEWYEGPAVREATGDAPRSSRAARKRPARK